MAEWQQAAVSPSIVCQSSRAERARYFEQPLQGVSSSGVRAAESGESLRGDQPIERAASGHHQACSLEISGFEWKLVHQLSSVSWRFASAFSLLLIWLVQSARFHFSFSCSQLVQAILFRVPKEASQMPICSTSSNSVERLLDCLPSLEEASAVRSRTRGLDFWFEDCTILDC